MSALSQNSGLETGVASRPIDSTHLGGSLALRVTSITAGEGEGSVLPMVWLRDAEHHKGLDQA
jgi:hypothetical protein